MRVSIAGADADNFWIDNIDTASAWKIHAGKPASGDGSSSEDPSSVVVVVGSALLLPVE